MPTTAERNERGLANQGLAWKAAFRFRALHPGAVPFDDLLQTCLLTLLRCAELYRPETGWQFSTYAMNAMWKEMLKLLTDGLIHVPKYLRHKGRPEYRAAAQRAQTVVPLPEDVLGREPEPWEDTEEALAALARLRPNERLTLEWLYGLNGNEPHTLAEVAARIGITKAGAAWLRGRALKRLRGWLK